MEVPSSANQENATQKVQKFVDNYVRLPENKCYPRIGMIDDVRKLVEVEAVVFHHPWSPTTQHEPEFAVIEQLLQIAPNVRSDTGYRTLIPSIGRWRFEDLEKLFAIYQEYLVCQEKIREHDLDFQILAYALPRLSRLQGVEIYQGGTCVPLQRSLLKHSATHNSILLGQIRALIPDISTSSRDPLSTWQELQILRISHDGSDSSELV